MNWMAKIWVTWNDSKVKLSFGTLLAVIAKLVNSKEEIVRFEMQINLKVQSCKLYNNKYMIASTQITYTEIFAVICILVFTILSRKVLFMNRKDSSNC